MVTKHEPSMGQAGINKDNAGELGKRGGKIVSEKKIFANSWRNRIYCNKTCQIWETCPLMSLSMKQKDKKGRHVCLLKTAPDKIQKRIFNLFLKGEDGIVAELRRILFDISADAEDSPKIRLAYYDRADKFKESVYGKILKQQVSGELKTGGYSAEDFRKTYEEIYGNKDTKRKDGKGRKA